MTTFIERLRLLMSKKGIKTDKELVEAGLISKNNIRNWEKGTTPQQATILALANYFNVTAEYLSGKTDNPLPKSSQFLAYLPYEKRGVRPIIGTASAGLGVIAEEMILGWQSVDDNFDSEDFFWLRIAGDSMSPKIDDGDLVLIQRDAEISNGCVAVVVVGGTDGFVKKVEFVDDSVILHSYNPYYPDMIFKGTDKEQLRFVGRARKVERDL